MLRLARKKRLAAQRAAKKALRIAEVSSLVTAENVAELQREFAKRPYGLTVEEFVKVMSVCLAGRMHSIGNDETAFACEMIELFKQVDVNGNGKMEWEEFTSYIVDSGSTVGVPLTPMKLPRKAMYQPGDTKEHGFPDADHCVERLVLLGLPCPSIALILKSSDTIRLMKRSVHKGQPGLIQECSLRHHTQFRSHRALGVTSSAEYECIISSSYDDDHGSGGFISFWVRDGRMMRLVSREPCNAPHDQLCYTSAFDTVYAGSSTWGNMIEGWKISFAFTKSKRGPGLTKSVKTTKIVTLRWHTAPVKQLLSIPANTDEYLLSCSFDGTIGVWSTRSNEVLQTVIAHDGGVRRAALSRQRGYIVSIGFGIVSQPHTLEAIVWSTGGMAGADGHQSESVAHKWKNISALTGHEYPLVDVAVQETPSDLAHVITADERGHIHRWSLEPPFDCLQKFTVPRPKELDSSVHSFFQTMLPLLALPSRHDLGHLVQLLSRGTLERRDWS